MQSYNDSLSDPDKEICDILAEVINICFPKAESKIWHRHPVGPDAIPFLEWRAAKSDEEWIDWNAVNDEDWYAAVSSEFGIDAKS